MAVHLAVGVEEVYKNRIVAHKTRGDEGVWEILDCHAPVVYSKLLIDTKLVCLLVHSEGINVELSVVHIPECKVSTIRILLEHIAFDALAMFSLADRDLMDQITRLNFINVHMRLVLIFLQHANHMLRVVRDEARDHDVRCTN